MDARTTVYELTIEENERLKGLLAAINLFGGLNNDMPLQMIRAYLTIAIEEGQGPNEVSRKMGVASAVASRHVTDLGEVTRHRDDRGHRLPGYDLIEQKTDIMDRRYRKAWLTPAGRAFRQCLLMALRS